MSVLAVVFPLVFAPLLVGVTNRTKAIFAGRTGQPLLQPYFDLYRLLNKGAVYSRTTTWVFRAGPIIGLSAVLVATAIMPLGPIDAPLRFQGDFILFAYLLGLARLFTVLAALDTGSAFEGMGASREVLFSALAEVALFLGLAAVARKAGSLSLTGMHEAISLSVWATAGLTVILVTLALFVVFLTENSRIPVDDPNTHLELTMIHEVMVLDHSGPDFAFILYTAALKLWLLGALIVGIVLPPGSGWFFGSLGLIGALLGMFALAVILGVIESTMARLRLMRVPEMLVSAATLSALALLLEYGGVSS
jgi:formate hydrogenlyase subunit 4